MVTEPLQYSAPGCCIRTMSKTKITCKTTPYVLSSLPFFHQSQYSLFIAADIHSQSLCSTSAPTFTQSANYSDIVSYRQRRYTRKSLTKTSKLPLRESRTFSESVPKMTKTSDNGQKSVPKFAGIVIIRQTSFLRRS